MSRLVLWICGRMLILECVRVVVLLGLGIMELRGCVWECVLLILIYTAIPSLQTVSPLVLLLNMLTLPIGYAKPVAYLYSSMLTVA